MPKISPFLWYDDKAEEAAEFYVKVFSEWSGATQDVQDHERRSLRRGDAGPAGTAMTVAFQVEGRSSRP